MKVAKAPVTAAVRMLREQGVDFEPHLYSYVDSGGTAHAARVLGVPEHAVIKTLVMQDDAGQPLLVLMHGDRQTSTRTLARQLGARSVRACSPEAARKHTGYVVGGISPFGTRRPLPVYVEQSIFGLERIYVNGGKRGLLVSFAPAELRRLLSPELVNVAVEA
jgi:Cys-tRNA(Pro) deacylase